MRKGFAQLLLLIPIFVLLAATTVFFYYSQSKSTKTQTSNIVSQSPSLLTTNSQGNAQQISPNSNSKLQIKILAKLPPEDQNIWYDWIFDPQETTTAYSVSKDLNSTKSTAYININGNAGKTYNEIEGLTSSPDGKHIAYIAKKDKKQFVVLDGVEGKKYEYIKNLKFSPDGQHIAYCAGEGVHFVPDSQVSGDDWAKTMFIVTDNVEGKRYDGSLVGANVSETYDPFFSKDGTKLTYTAVKNGKNIIVLNNNELSAYSNQQYPQFIGDSYEIAYLAQENDKYFAVVSGYRKNSHDYIPHIFIGNDSSQIAFEATDSNNTRSVLVNDVPYSVIPSGELGGLHDFSFSKTGKNFAYYSGAFKSNYKMYINGQNVAQGTIENVFKVINNLIFSPNENTMVYSEYNSNQQNAVIHIFSVNPAKKIVDYSLPDFKFVGEFKFSDDSKYIYFKGFQNRNIVFATLNIEQIIKDSTK